MESTCNSGDTSSIPGSGSSPGELPSPVFLGFPGGSDGKESACNARDHGSIPGSGSSPGEGIGYPCQYSWASLVAQLVKDLPAMRETWVWSLGWEDPLEKGMATHSNILACRIPWTEERDRLQSMGLQRVGHKEVTKHSKLRVGHTDSCKNQTPVT